MAKTKAKWINKISDHFTTNTDDMEIKFDVAGALSATASGLRVEPLGVTNAMLAGSIESSKLADEAQIAFLNQTETVTAVWTFNSLPQSSVAPSTGSDLTNKDYVDSIAAGLDPKESVRIATVADTAADIYLPAGGTVGTGALSGVDLTSTAIFDGLVDDDLASITLGIGDRILIKNQADAKQNGIYVVTVAGATGELERATDQDGNPGAEVSAGNYTFVEGGTTNVNAGFVLQGDGALTLNTDDLIWVQFSGAGSITAGTGLSKSGNTIDFNAADASLTVNANDVAVNLDPTYLETTVSGVTIKMTSITNDRLVNDDVTITAGNGLSDGGAVALGASVTLNVNPAQLIQGGNAAIDGDELDVTYSATNYTATDTTLSGHLTGINNKLLDVVDGPASSTDNALVRWDGTTGQLIQNSTSTLSDAGLMTVGTGGAGSGELVVNGQLHTPMQTLSYGANIATNCANGNVFEVTLTGATAQLDAPTNLKDGATYMWVISQDATGGRLLTFPAAFNFSDGTTPTLSTAANAVDILTMVSDGTNLYGSLVSNVPLTHAADHQLGGDDEIDGDLLGISLVPTNYTPDTSNAPATLSGHLGAHLLGIDEKLGQLGSAETRIVHTISGGETTAGFFTLGTAPVPASVKLFVVFGPQQVNKAWSASIADYEILSTNQLHFNNNGAGTGLTGDLTTGDEVVIFYNETI